MARFFRTARQTLRGNNGCANLRNAPFATCDPEADARERLANKCPVPFMM